MPYSMLRSINGVEGTHTFDALKCVHAVQSIDKELVTLPKMWHVLVKEPGNEKIITRILDWILERA
jgi:hypothetical protein